MAVGRMKMETGSRGQDYFKSSERCAELSLESSPQQVVINNAENIELHTTAVCVGTKGLEDLFCRETAKLQKKQHKGQKKIINKTFTARNKDATL